MSFNIRDFLKKLSKFREIDFSKEKEIYNNLAQKYDKNNNSVFESDELQEIKDDLIKFASEDQYRNELSDVEALHFVENMLPENTASGSVKCTQESSYGEYVKNLLSNLNRTGEQNQLEFIRNKLSELDDKRKISKSELKQLRSLSTEELERAVQLFYIEGRDEQFSMYDIVLFSKFSEKEFERLKQLFYVEGRKEQFYTTDIVFLSELSDEEFERAKGLFFTNIRGEEPDGSELSELAKLSEDELSWAFENMFEREYPISICASLAQNASDELLEFLNNNPGVEPLYTVDNSAKFVVDGKYYTFNKSGLVETGEEKKLPDNENMKKGTVVTLFNKRLNVLQTVTSGEIPGNIDDKDVFEESLVYYGTDGNIFKTVNITRNFDTGTLNVSETDNNGITRQIQRETVDSKTGARIIERHLVSPAGTRTDYHSEDRGNLRTTDSKITDKNGNVLINLHQTFEKTGENRFVSSINTTEDESNAQVYEIEYSDDNVVKILDRTSGQSTEIDMNEYFVDEESIEKMMPYIKELPGQILLKFAENKLDFEYDETSLLDGGWFNWNTTLTVGNYDNTTNERDDFYTTLVHELGHYLDIYDGDALFANNPQVKEIYDKEFNEFISATTTEQQNHIGYLVGSDSQESAQERVAETHALLYSNGGYRYAMRHLYFAQYFPETVAAITKLLLEDEGVKAE